MVSSAEDERTASRVAVERAAEALDADLAVLLKAGDVVASVGFRPDPVVAAALADIADGHTARLIAPGVPDRPALAITVEPDTPARLVFARDAEEFTGEEVYLARGMAHVLSLSLRLFRLAAEERRQRREAEMQSELNQRLLDSLQERQELLERLARIQRSITHGAVREDVLDAICLGARELLGDEVAGLQLVPPDDPDVLEIVAMRGRDALELRGAGQAGRRARLARDGGGPPGRLRGLPERSRCGQLLQGPRHPRRDGGARARVRAPGGMPDRRLVRLRPPLQLDRARHAARVRGPREPRALRRAQHPGDARGRRRPHPGPLPLAREQLVGHDHR
jgi:hypothetical protein